MSTGSRKVGYGSPPPEHQFKKGQSGNPRGRPRKSLNRKTVLVQTLSGLILAEAARTITVREGESVVEMSVQAALVRSISVKAFKGDGFYAKMFQQMISLAEREDAEQRQSQFEAAFEYKEIWGKEFARCEREGLPLPQPLPHPDDIQIDFASGAVSCVGPVTEEHRQAMEDLAKFLDKRIEQFEDPDRLATYAPQLRRKLRKRQLARIEKFNRVLPPSLKRTWNVPSD